MPESEPAEFANTCAAAGRNYVVSGCILLQHQPHGFNVIGSIAPVALRFQIAQPQLALQTKLYPRYAVADLPRDKFNPTQWRFVIEQNSAARKCVKALAIVHGHPVGIEFGHAVRASRIKRCTLRLDGFLNLSKHLTAGSLIKANRRIGEPDCFQQIHGSNADRHPG